MRLDATFPAPSYGALPYGVHEQPLADPPSAGQWSHSHIIPSVDKGKARATEQILLCPVYAGNDGK